MTWTKEQIVALLDKSDKMVEKSLLVLFERQTSDEQVSEQTRHNNGVGFSGVDAEFLTSCAKGLQKYGHLTAKQLPIVRRKMKKYARQLTDEANKRASVAAA